MVSSLMLKQSNSPSQTFWAVQLTITNLKNSVTFHHKPVTSLNLNNEELTIKIGNFFKFVKRNLPQVRVTSLIWK